MTDTYQLPGKIVFLHIPKAGGTSLHIYLASHFEPGDVFHALRGTDVLAAAVKDFRFYSGHFYWQTIVAIPDRRVITVLREPTERVLSEFFYFKSFREDYLNSHSMEYIIPFKNMTVTEYLEDALYRENTENKQTRFFLDEEDISPSQEILNPVAALQKAIARLDETEAVGLFEHLDLSATLIARVLRLKPGIPLPRLNVTDLNHQNSDAFEKIERIVTPEHIEAIRRKNALDARLYEHAKSRFYSLMRQHLPVQADFADTEK